MTELLLDGSAPRIFSGRGSDFRVKCEVPGNLDRFELRRWATERLLRSWLSGNRWQRLSLLKGLDGAEVHLVEVWVDRWRPDQFIFGHGVAVEDVDLVGWVHC